MPHSPTRPLHASIYVTPAGPWPQLLDCLCAAFPAISRAVWQARFLRGRILDEQQQPLPAETPHRAGRRIYYFRELPAEPRIPFREQILYQDEHLLVADKPAFLPVIPAGQFARETLLSRLSEQLGNAQVQPIHRLDRHTAGLVLFSLRKDSRARYQALFRDQQITKYYEALAPALPDLVFPHHRHSRIERDQQFFRSCETSGPCNARTEIHLLAKGQRLWHYRLIPVTGKKHQLRLHMAALGAPILHDAFYPQVDNALAENYQRPLQLLASHVHFRDPLSGQERQFSSRQHLVLADWDSA